jgi:hypothetical protein
MGHGTDRWLQPARLLHHIKLSAGEPCGCRTTVDAPVVAARVQSLERCYGVRLPPSYREFMLRYDGWPNVFRGASLLSTAQMHNPSWHHRAQMAIDRASPAHLPARHGRVRAQLLDDNLIPIGLDPAGSIVFLLDAETVESDGEMGAVAWISELGVRVPSFSDLLELFCELTTRGAHPGARSLDTCAA